MITRQLGDSGLATPPLILGGNVFGWTADEQAGRTVLDAFVAGGGTMIDTADVYSKWIPGHSGGESEAAIGRWLKARGHRDDVLIATKVGMLEGEGGAGLAPARIAAALDASLKRLGTDHVDLFYAHRDDPSQPIEDVLGAFDALIEAGKVRAIGASNYTVERLGAALAASKTSGLPRYSVLQPHYNLIERANFEAGLQALCIAEGIGVAPYYALASGFLTGKYRTQADLSQSPRGGRAALYLEGKGPAVLAALDRVAEETRATQAQVSLAWLAARPGVTAPIASATSVKQLEELLGAMRLVLTSEQLDTLDAASAT